MLTLKELENWVLHKIGLRMGQEIKGLDLWNHLVQKGLFQEIRFFLGLIKMYTLKESIISDDEITNVLFNPEISGLDENQYSSLLDDYRISSVKIDDGYDSKIRTQIISISGQYRQYKGSKGVKKNRWSSSEWILFEMRIQ